VTSERVRPRCLIGMETCSGAPEQMDLLALHRGGRSFATGALGGHLTVSISRHHRKADIRDQSVW